MRINHAIVLAGGDGTRFWPLHGKSTYPFLGKPIFKHIVDAVEPFVERITIVVSENIKERVIALAPQAHIIVQKPDVSGMAGAIISCKGSIHGNVLILNAEDIVDFSIFNQYLSILESGEKDYILLAKKVTSYFPGAYLKYEGTRIAEIIEKPDADKVPSNKTKLVAEYFSNFDSFLEILAHTKTAHDDLYEQAINQYLRKYQNGVAVDYDGYWQALKYPWHVLDMAKLFLSQMKGKDIGKNTVISPTAVISGNVHIGNNVRIGDFVKISGPVYIGDDVTIGDHSLVRDSHIGNNVLIGSGSEVARSYVNDGVMIHRNYIGDSVLDCGVLIGAGAVTANFRFDAKTILSRVADLKIDSQHNKLGCIAGAGSKIGVNTTIIPGIKIGSRSYVGPGEIVKQDIPDNMFLFEGTLKENKL